MNFSAWGGWIGVFSAVTEACDLVDWIWGAVGRDVIAVHQKFFWTSGSKINNLFAQLRLAPIHIPRVSRPFRRVRSWDDIYRYTIAIH
uniref:Uncharacterized protein n=1 Tax=Arcella intermedia TaxID=1963864 RepID=A0A6B2LQS3_9EUKA